jgi:hypothetical protein
MNNRLSRTNFEFTKDRIQHYSQDPRKCRDCGHIYYPKVHSQSYVVQLGAVFTGVFLYYSIREQNIDILNMCIPVFILLFMFFYHRKDRKAVSPKMDKVKYGQVVVECPECGKDKP